MYSSFPMRFPLTTMFDTGNQGHIGFVVAVSNSIADGYNPPFYRGWVRAQMYSRVRGIPYIWYMSHQLQD